MINIFLIVIESKLSSWGKRTNWTKNEDISALFMSSEYWINEGDGNREGPVKLEKHYPGKINKDFRVA